MLKKQTLEARQSALRLRNNPAAEQPKKDGRRRRYHTDLRALRYKKHESPEAQQAFWDEQLRRAGLTMWRGEDEHLLYVGDSAMSENLGHTHAFKLLGLRAVRPTGASPEVN